jgi:hypothetical protein
LPQTVFVATNKLPLAPPPSARGGAESNGFYGKKTAGF